MKAKQQKRLEVLENIDTSEMTLEEMSNIFSERSELLLLRNKENINFILRGNDKYYYANQCYEFTQNLLKYGFNGFHTATKEEVKEKGICFNKYSINLGYNEYCQDLKRFNSRDEMLGFVIGYNEASTESV
tara:strand:+ start:274 stop:666 length:393 start_codon:yes stop_codon:yes gene_type:complete